MSRRAINLSSSVLARKPDFGDEQHADKDEEAPEDLVGSEGFIQKENGYDRGINGYQIEKDRNLGVDMSLIVE